MYILNFLIAAALGDEGGGCVGYVGGITVCV